MTPDRDTTVRETKRDAIYASQVCLETIKPKFPMPPSEAGAEDNLLPSDGILESIRELERGDGIHNASLGELWADLDS